MARPNCYDSLNVKKGLWSADEDAKVLAYVSKHGTGNWTAAPKKAGLKRCGKSCRLRYTNYLRPDLKQDSFSPQEEEMIVKFHSAIGSRWSIIAQQLPGRTDNDVKNYWNTKLRKKLSEMGIDPVTHRPFSQILADYGNISGDLSIGGNSNIQNGSFLNRDLKNALMIKPGHYYQSQALINCQFTENLMSPPQSDITQNSFFNINYNNESYSNSFGLLAQLQSIKLVTDQTSNYIKNEAIQPNFVAQSLIVSPSSSSSSSTCSTAAQAFSWQDYILEDAFFPSVSLGSETQSYIMPQTECISAEEKIIGGMNYGGLGNSFEASTSNHDASFVETMLERDNEMLLEFPSLLEEPFYY